jgi:hypothetical protein
MKSRDSKSSKKPYYPPRLVIYGDLRTLTQAQKVSGTPDGVFWMGKQKAS